MASLLDRLRPPPVPAPLKSSELAGLCASVEKIASDLAAHRAITESQGQAIANLPAATLKHLETEVARIASDLAAATFKRAREEAFSQAVKWGVRIALSVAGTWLVTQYTVLLGSIQK